jgi:predicted ATPase
MLERIQLEHFKCFELLKLPLAPLTLLSGLNASGKSTSIQSLALIHQTLTENPGSSGLILNGKNVSLGTADELVDKVSGRDSFAIGFEDDQISALWRFGVDPDDTMIAPLLGLRWRQFAGGVGEDLQTQSDSAIFQLVPHQDISAGSAVVEMLASLYQTIRTLTYVSADRIGPRETYPASSRAQQTGVGARGEFTPWYIEQYAELPIPESMCRRDTPPQLKRQVEAWLASFFPGSALEIQPIERTNQFAMRLRTSDATNYHRPTNVGYGLSHVLPVIAACLGAVGFAHAEQRLAPLVLVENPELHLHPAGQSAMGVFLARAAASGAQVIIETHSDHVLNGIRRAVKGVDGVAILRPDQVAIHFFQPRDSAGLRPQVISPLIDANGTIDAWPEGFFDQFDKDTASLIDW